MRQILYILYFLTGLAIEGFILWLFPYTGLGGLICWPTAFVLSLGCSFILFLIAKKLPSTWQVIIPFLILITVQSYFQLSITPQDYGGSVFSKIADTRDAFSTYVDLKYDDFPILSGGKRVAYIHKFQQKLPDSFTVLTIDSLRNGYESVNPRRYLIEHHKENRLYDKSKIEIIESGTTTIITEFHNADTLVYTMHRNFMTSGTGYNDRTISISINEDNFKLKTGIEKLLYTILTITKKPNS